MKNDTRSQAMRAAFRRKAQKIGRMFDADDRIDKEEASSLNNDLIDVHVGMRMLCLP